MPANRRAVDRQNGVGLPADFLVRRPGGRIGHTGVHAEISTAKKRADATRRIFGKEFRSAKGEYRLLVANRSGRIARAGMRKLLSPSRRVVPEEPLDRQQGARREGIHRVSDQL